MASMIMAMYGAVAAGFPADLSILCHALHAVDSRTYAVYISSSCSHLVIERSLFLLGNMLLQPCLPCRLRVQAQYQRDRSRGPGDCRAAAAAAAGAAATAATAGSHGQVMAAAAAAAGAAPGRCCSCCGNQVCLSMIVNRVQTRHCGVSNKQVRCCRHVQAPSYPLNGPHAVTVGLWTDFFTIAKSMK